MFITPWRSLAGAALTALALSACGGATVSLSPASVNLAPAQAEPAVASSLSGAWMYTAQLYGEDLGVYRQEHHTLAFVKTITQGVSSPQGTVATVDGWWYVSNSGHSNVLVFRTKRHGPVGPVSTLDDYGQLPSNVDAVPSRRLVAVSNFSTTGGAAGSVSVYVDRRAEPSRILTYGKDLLHGAGVAIDRRGDCYWSFDDSNAHSGSIVEFDRCGGKGTLVVSGLSQAGGIAFDRSGNLYYVDRTTGIYKCKKTAHCALFSTGFGLPVNVNFDRKDKHLWVADASGYIDAVDPKTGAIVYRVPAHGGAMDPPFGIAPAPGG